MAGISLCFYLNIFFSFAKDLRMYRKLHNIIYFYTSRGAFTPQIGIQEKKNFELLRLKTITMDLQ